MIKIKSLSLGSLPKVGHPSDWLNFFIGVLWEVFVLGKLEDDLLNILRQFISVDDLLRILVEAEQTTKQNAAVWLLTSGVLGRTKELIFIDEYLLVEYKNYDNEFYQSPFDTLTLIAQGEEAFFTDCIGFARRRILIDIKNEGLNISDELIQDSSAYISAKSYEYDDNFYKNQCIDLMNNLKAGDSYQEILPKTKEINYFYLLDKNNRSYIPKFALLLRITHDLITNERFTHKPTKQERIADCLDEYGHHYGVQNTLTNVNHFSNLINTRDKSKDMATNTMSKIISQE